MILITVISVILAFLIIGSMISEKYFLGFVLILASVALAVLNDKVDDKIHNLGESIGKIQ